MEDVEANENNGFQTETIGNACDNSRQWSVPTDDIDLANEADDEVNENEEEEETNIDEENKVRSDNESDKSGSLPREEGGSPDGISEASSLDYHDKLRQSMDVMQGTVKGSTSMNQNRLVTKEGIVDVKYINSPGLKTRFMRDLFHTLMDAKWRYTRFLYHQN